MAKFNIGDKVKVVSKPEFWPSCTEFLLLGAEGTVDCWVDWPEAMDKYAEYLYVNIDKAEGDGKIYEGAKMLFHDHTLEIA